MADIFFVVLLDTEWIELCFDRVQLHEIVVNKLAWVMQMHGLTALHFACQCGHTSTAQLLLDRGADVTVQDQVACMQLTLLDCFHCCLL